MDIAGDSIAG